MTTIQEKLVEVATVANAKEYFATPTDRFVFCLDLLELSLVEDGDGFCDTQVNRLENLFSQIKFADFFEDSDLRFPGEFWFTKSGEVK